MIEKFDRLHGLPDGFFDITTANIRSLFPNPTLIQLDGRDPRFLFVSILLHGNEYTGLEVMQKILSDHAHDLPRSILLFIGNVRAAEANRRLSCRARSTTTAAGRATISNRARPRA